MVLIISRSSFDITTETVIDWLFFNKQKFVRMSGEEIFKMDKYFKDVKCIWYRGLLSLNSLSGNFQTDSIHNTIIMEKNLVNEANALRDFFFHKFKEKKWLSSYRYGDVNKLIVLEHAKKIGLKIPETIILNNKIDLLKFKNNNRIITKSISNPLPINNSISSIIFYTEEIGVEEINNLPETFPNSCFQELVEKKFEVRVFVLNSKLYSMAIFPELEDNCVDYRKNNISERKVPYKLSKNLEEKILKLTKKMNLKTASIDLIYSVNNEIYFLELNPNGQFGDLSSNCNYYLEREIANQLTSY